MNFTSVTQEHDIFLKNLRAETSGSHKDLEDNERSKGILSPEVSMKVYQAYLAKMYGVVAACERDVYPMLTSLFDDLEQREKSHLILQDLAVTGMDEAAIEALKIHSFNPANMAQALGIVYVMEGSTLGGKVLFKHIQKVLGLNESSGAAFFWGYGADTGMMWKSFVSIFSDYAVLENVQRDVIESANETFTVVDQWLNA
jgi:heme oxygenase